MPVVRLRSVAAFVVVAAASLGCSGDDASGAHGAMGGADGGPSGCAPGEKPLDTGACQPAGVTAALCAQGFTPDNAAGCVPVLPSDPCGPGLIAVPGESSCHPVADCGTAAYGAVVDQAGTQYVDGSYAGTDSDGTLARPWRTIQDAIDSATDGATVAITDGTYAEDVRVIGKAVQIIGRCPERVEIVGTAAALFVREGADGTVVRGLSLRGVGSYGFVLSGSTNVTVDHLWVHDTARGIEIGDVTGATSVTLTDTLVESAREIGMLVYGVEGTIERITVRDTKPLLDGTAGRGIGLQDDADTGTPAKVTLRRSVVERNRSVGVYVWGSDVTIEGSLVRDTQSDLGDGLEGRGIGVEDDAKWHRRGNATLRSTVLANNAEFGVFVAGSDALIEGLVVRDMQSEMSTGKFGRCIDAQDDPDTHERSALTLRASLLDHCRDVALAIFGSDATVESLAIRDTATKAADDTAGRGIAIQAGGDPGQKPAASLKWSTVDRSIEFGISASDGTVTVEASAIRDVAPQAAGGLFGDGISAYTNVAPATVDIRDTIIERSARAGISALGSGLTIAGTTLDCDAIDLDGEALGGANATLVDHGGNVCGCAGATRGCQVLSSDLQPPAPLAPGTTL